MSSLVKPLRHRRAAWRGAFVAALLSVIAQPIAAAASHNDEIQAYAALTAMAQIASDRCAEILVNNEMIESAPTFFHITPGDERSVRFAYDLEMRRLSGAIDAAPSLRAWCDAAYRAYGPAGDAVKGLLGK